MRPDIKKAFDFVSTQLGNLRLTKTDHVFVQQVLDKAMGMITSEPEKKESLTPKK